MTRSVSHFSINFRNKRLAALEFRLDRTNNLLRFSVALKRVPLPVFLTKNRDRHPLNQVPLVSSLGEITSNIGSNLFSELRDVDLDCYGLIPCLD